MASWYTDRQKEAMRTTLFHIAFDLECEHIDAEWFLHASAPLRGRSVQYSDDSNVFDQGECGVCLDSLAEGDLTVLNCGHLLHQNCATQAFRIRPVCPYCKQLVHIKTTDCFICTAMFSVSEAKFDRGCLCRFSCCGITVHEECMARFRNVNLPVHSYRCPGCLKKQFELHPIVTA